uniref:ISXO2-like transposase domain-containing protein n=1 Tax=Trichuris muris TaxID=70415 RepID=A0A5S6Q4M3_TRIMR
MVLQTTDGRPSRWRCNKRSCGKEFSFRTGTWLDGSRIPVHILLRFMYYWSREWSNVRDVEEQLGLNHSSVVAWNLAMREVVAETLVTNRVPVGGPGLTVQVDETVYSKRKSNRGRSYPQQWVFAGVCLKTGECFMMSVPDRSSATLISAVS